LAQITRWLFIVSSMPAMGMSRPHSPIGHLQ
jgi:hypothetical protein